MPNLGSVCTLAEMRVRLNQRSQDPSICIASSAVGLAMLHVRVCVTCDTSYASMYFFIEQGKRCVSFGGGSHR